MANPEAAACAAQTLTPGAQRRPPVSLMGRDHPEVVQHLASSNDQLAAQLAKMMREEDPLLEHPTNLLVLPYEVQLRAAYASQCALQALADIFHSHAQADLERSQHAGHRPTMPVPPQTEHMAYLIETIARQMEPLNDLSSLDTALTLRDRVQRAIDRAQPTNPTTGDQS